MFTTTTTSSCPSSQLFQTYLLPSVPFRRRQSSSATTATTSSSYTSSSTSSSSSAKAYLYGHTSHISCAKCHADLALTSQIISKGFTGRHGRAYLVSPAVSPSAGAFALAPTSISSHPGLLPNLPNTQTHKPAARQLVTGLHTVCDVSCALCDSTLGWKYVGAEDEAQRYKIGKFILETKRVAVTNCWENDGDEGEGDEIDDFGDLGGSGGRFGDLAAEEEDVLFDSQDEDECEDLFAGIWSPQLASRRRQRTQHLMP